MARLPRLEIPGQPHLIVQSGSVGQAAFADDADRAACRDALRRALEETGVALHAYVLAGNEIWLLATPEAAGALGRTMQSLGRRYVMAFNARHGRRGTLWESRFRTAVIEPERYLLTVMHLIETVPVREHLVTHAQEWIWSSARHHLGQAADPMLTDPVPYWSLGNTPFERASRYGELLAQPAAEALQHAALSCLKSGWVLGSSEYVAALAASTGRRLAPRPRGRPRQRADAEPGSIATD